MRFIPEEKIYSKGGEREGREERRRARGGGGGGTLNAYDMAEALNHIIEWNSADMTAFFFFFF